MRRVLRLVLVLQWALGSACSLDTFGRSEGEGGAPSVGTDMGSPPPGTGGSTGSPSGGAEDTAACVPAWERCESPTDENCDTEGGCAGTVTAPVVVLAGALYPTAVAASAGRLYLSGRATSIAYSGGALIPPDDDGLNEGFVVSLPRSGSEPVYGHKVEQDDTMLDETAVDVMLAPNGDVFALIVASQGPDRVLHLSPELQPVASRSFEAKFSAAHAVLADPGQPFPMFVMGSCEPQMLCVAVLDATSLSVPSYKELDENPSFLASAAMAMSSQGVLYIAGSWYQTGAFIRALSQDTLAVLGAHDIVAADAQQTYLLPTIAWDDVSQSLLVAGVVSGSGVVGLTADSADSASCPLGMACPEQGDFFIARYASLGASAAVALRSTPSLAGDEKEISSIAMDGAGNVLVTGRSAGTLDFGTLNLRGSTPTDSQMFALKLTGDELAPIWGYPGVSSGFSTGIAASAGVEGYVLSVDLLPTTLPFELGGFTQSLCPDYGCTNLLVLLGP